MKVSAKIILPIILISALLILLAGCFVTPSDEEPGYTPGTITGIIAAPCCTTSSDPVAETSGSPEYWCYYCQQTWSLQDGVEVVLTYGEDEVATTTTNSEGEYTFTDVSPGKNYVITALCPDYDDNRPLVKDVALEVASTFDAKITDLVSTSLGLVVDFLVVYTEWGPEDISLDEVIADKPGFPNFPKFKALVYEVRRVLELENCGNVDTDDDVQEALCLAAEEISKLDIGCAPGYTPPPPPPPPGPCDGNTEPVVNEVTLDDGVIVSHWTLPPPSPIYLIVGTSYELCVDATDPDNKLPQDLTYTFGGYETGTVNCVDVILGCESIGTHILSIEVSDGCDTTTWGPFTWIVCPEDPYLEIAIDDSNPCSNECATITSVEWWDGDCLIETFVPPYDAYPGLSWIVDSGISFDPTDGTVCLTDVEIGTDYFVDFTYEDECGGTATETAIVNFKAGPTAEAGGPFYEGSAETSGTAEITLDGSGSTAGGAPIFSYAWSETTLGYLGSDKIQKYDFAPGDYTVTLTVTDENGCTDTDTAEVKVHQKTTHSQTFMIAFEDLTIEGSNDWDYNDFVGLIEVTYHIWSPGLLEKIDFTMIKHVERLAGHTHELHVIIDGYDGGHTYSDSPSIVGLTGDDFHLFDPTDLTIDDVYTLTIDFDDNLVSFGNLTIDFAKIHGDNTLPFTFYLENVSNSQSIGNNNDDIRKLIVPDDWTIPAATVAIWDVYTNVGGSYVAGPDFSGENGTWVPAP